METASPAMWTAGHGTGGANDDIDMDALRAKYSRPREQILAEQQQKDRQASGAGYAKGAPPAKVGYDSLSDIVMCQACQALGTLKKQYGFRVMDEVCEMCDGEGVIRKGQMKLASDELKKKVRQVEALIEHVDDLDLLERYEAALQKRTIEALNAVLSPPPTPAGTPAAAEAEEPTADEEADETPPPLVQ